MAEVLAPDLHLYKDPVINVPDIHPALQDVVPILHDPVIVDGSTIYSVEFASHFNSQELQDVLAEPVAPFVETYSTVNFRKGLRSQTYPNGRVMKAAHQHVGLGLLGHLREIRPDLLQLVDAVEQDVREQRVPTTLHVYDDDSALGTAGNRAVAMNAAKLRELCDEAGIDVNELALWKLRGGNRAVPHKFTQDMLRLGLSPLEIQQAIVDRDFVTKWVINSPRFASALFDRGELPRAAALAKAPFVELVSRLQDPAALPISPLPNETEDDMDVPKPERWRVNLLKRNIARRVVNAVISFRYEESAGERRKRLVLTGATSRYNPVTREVVYGSPVTGSALLVSTVINGSELIDKLKLANEVRPGSNYYKSYKPGTWNYTKNLPRQVVGTFPAILGQYVNDGRVVNSERFQALEDLVHGR